MGVTSKESILSRPKYSKHTLKIPPTDDNGKVLEYLVKKGYTRTEQVLRVESSHDGGPVKDYEADKFGNMKYIRAFELLAGWIDSNLDIYKVL